MSPTAMLTLMVAAFAMFAWSASRRWRLAQIGRPLAHGARLDYLATRLAGTWTYAFRQEKMDYYSPAGIAHKFIFAGFVVLLFRTLVLWGRGFYAPFNLLVLEPRRSRSARCTSSPRTAWRCSSSAGRSSSSTTDSSSSRSAWPCRSRGSLDPRHHLHDDGRRHDVRRRVARARSQDRPVLRVRAGTPRSRRAVRDHRDDHRRRSTARRWTRRVVGVAGAGGLVLRVALRDELARRARLVRARRLLDPRDARPRLPEPAPALEALPRHHGDPERLPAEPRARAGASSRWPRTPRSSWRRSAPRAKRPTRWRCPSASRASSTSPGRRSSTSTRAPSAAAARTTARRTARARSSAPSTSRSPSATTSTGAKRSSSSRAQAARSRTAHGRAARGRDPRRQRPPPRPNRREARRIEPINLVPDVIHPDVLWACTTCRACEEQCPVLISYVDKIVDMRRNLVMVKGEFPHELAKPFQGMEVNGNPWNLSRMDRAALGRRAGRRRR